MSNDELPRFIAIDGEGYTKEDNTHIFNLIGASDGSYLHDNDGLRTPAVFDYFMQLKTNFPEHVFVSFYFSYDVNMLLGNMPRKAIDCLKDKGYTFVYNPADTSQAYHISYMPRKFFKIAFRKRNENEGSRRWKTITTITIWDVWGFFQGSFLNALKEFHVGTSEEHALLSRMKAARADFQSDELTEILHYNMLECRLLVQLMDLLAISLRNAGLNLKSWHGAGAVANALLGKYGVDTFIANPTGNHKYPVLCAYFGGRIQSLKLGEIRNNVYGHDIVSAYPSITQDLPSFDGMKQRRIKKYEPNLEYCIYHVVWNIPHTSPVSPFPFRYKDGSISYPFEGEGYYWACEVRMAIKHFGQDCITVLCGFVFDIKDGNRPFAFIPKLFEMRRQFKREGNHAQYAIKLGLNSLYGKTAQGEGWGGKKPQYQCYMWAGLITAGTRAKMLDLAMSNPESVLGFSTDGLFATEKLTKETEGKPLGSWEITEYRCMFIVKPGFYRGRTIEGKTIRKVRGFMSREIKFYKVLAEWRKNHVNGRMEVPCRRFIGMKATRDYKLWRQWIDSTRELSLMPIKGLPELVSDKPVVYKILSTEAPDYSSRAYDGKILDELQNSSYSDSENG